MIWSSKHASRSAVLMAFAHVWACSPAEQEDKPPIKGGSGAGVPVVRAPGGAGGESPESTDADVEVVGFQADDFRLTEPFSGAADLAGRDANGGFVTGSFDGTSGTLARLHSGDQVWVGALPSDTSDFLGAWSRADTTADRLQIPVVPRAALVAIFETLIVPTPVAPGAGHIAVRVVDSQGEGVSGVTVAVSGAEFVSYWEGVWTDGTDRTGLSGRAFAGNLTAQSFPGRLVNLVLGGTVSLNQEVLLAADTVTVVEIVKD